MLNCLTSDVIEEYQKGEISLEEACEVLRMRGHSARTIEALEEDAENE